MSRIILISDTHHGGGPEGYRMQVCYTHRLPELLAALATWMAETGGADLLLHAGDAVERSEPSLVAQAVGQLETVHPRIHLALGNHDLTTPDALDLWLKRAGELLPAGHTAFSATLDDCTIHVLPTQWGNEPYFWDGGPPRASLDPADLAWLDARLYAEPDRAQIVVCHAAPAGVPAEQTGRSEEMDPPPLEYTLALRELAERHANLRLFCSGHSHINALGKLGPAQWLMASSFSESPFECKEILVGPGLLSVRTVALFDAVDWRAGYNWDAAYVQGRPCDRTLEVRW